MNEIDKLLNDLEKVEYKLSITLNKGEFKIREGTKEWERLVKRRIKIRDKLNRNI